MMSEPFQIQRNGIYTDGPLVLGLGLTHAALARARRTGELRFTKVGKQTLYRGEWVLAWLERKCKGVRRGK